MLRPEGRRPKPSPLLPPRGPDDRNAEDLRDVGHTPETRSAETTRPGQRRRDHCACDTEDMLNPSTTTGGITHRVNQSLHSRDNAGTVAPTSTA